MSRTMYVVSLVMLGAMIGMLPWWLPPPPQAPWDTAILRGDAPDSLQMHEQADESGVFCIWSWRDGVRHRVPAAAAVQGSVGFDPTKYRSVEPLPGAHLCYRLTPSGSRI